MDILFPEHKDDVMVKVMFEAVQTQSVDLSNHPRWKNFFEENPAKFNFPQVQFEDEVLKKSAEAE